MNCKLNLVLEVPRIWHYNKYMNIKKDDAGFDKAVKDCKAWKVMEIWFAKDVQGKDYWEIEMDTWYNDGREPTWERLAYGGEVKEAEAKWDELIKEHKPDEHYCEDGAIDYQALSDKLDKEAEEA